MMVIGGLANVLSLVIVLLGVAYFVIIERKGLGTVQLRQGPNKPTVAGLLLPVADGLKLLSKEWVVPIAANQILFLAGPIFVFFFAYSLWLVYPVSHPMMYFKLSALYFLCMSSVKVFGVIMCGWSSNCQYGLLGAMRAAAQSVSYEVGFSTLMLCPLLYLGSFELYEVRMDGGIFFISCLEVFFMWFVSALAETNRTPFDFVEGESELVSGYMVEYGAFGFTLLVLAEYGSIMFISVLTSVLFFSVFPDFYMVGDFVVTCIAVFISYLFIVVRGTLPRYRYDKLMELCWKVVLPLAVAFFMISMVVGL
uniref:NADH-ubiquinone oxidoreductase chain 1 n=1 Tax=Solecurtus divaricatus TaxID=444102 RepID=I6NIN7_9BIVA|nr:NADH dehydrogenase subunit 1 [Solecurtus divaricatus]AEV94331.1 NADH dehydrogenase subunit 1 [Solecurtus divaricatus]